VLPEIPRLPRQRVCDPSQPHVQEFCTEVSPTEKPVFIIAAPDTTAAPEDCFEVVRSKVDEEGGDTVFGWLIAEIPGVMIESIFHAVWRDRAGAIHDISPLTMLPNKRLFLPDSSRKYEGRQVNNIRKALRDDPAVHRLIRAMDRLFEVTNAGDRATQVGTVLIPEDEIGPVKHEIAAAVRALTASAPNVTPKHKVGRNDPCPCGSGRKYKKCCGGHGGTA